MTRWVGITARLWLILGMVGMLGISPLRAQSASIGLLPDSGILISHARTLRVDPRLNMEKSLVNIRAVDAPAVMTHDGQTGSASEERYGQGIILDNAGVIVTNKHVIGNAEHVYVRLANGKTFEANVLHNSQTDLSLIKIDAPYPLKAIPLADSTQTQVGSQVIAFENAENNPERKLGGQVLQVFKESPQNAVEAIEMNIPLQPGDSGGPIFNEQGSLVGLIVGNQKSQPNNSIAIGSNRIHQEYLKYRKSNLS